MGCFGGDFEVLNVWGFPSGVCLPHFKGRKYCLGALGTGVL